MGRGPMRRWLPLWRAEGRCDCRLSIYIAAAFPAWHGPDFNRSDSRRKGSWNHPFWLYKSRENSTLALGQRSPPPPLPILCLSSPELRRSLSVAPLIADKRCYGEATVRLRRGYGAVTAASGREPAWR